MISIRGSASGLSHVRRCAAVFLAGRALGVATVFNWMFQMMVNMAFEPLVHATSTATTFGLSFFVCLLALGFIHAFLPETRGLVSNCHLIFPHSTPCLRLSFTPVMRRLPTWVLLSAG
jgi:hypothetical protein